MPSIRSAVGALPRSVQSSARRLRGGAVDNARSAASTISQRVADRRQLDPDGAGSGPGALSRLDEQECLELLGSRSVGRLAYVARPGVPDVVPVNFALRGRKVLVRSGVGPKLQAAERGDLLALEVDDIDEDTHAGWSVVVVGPARRLDDAERAALPEGVLPETWAKGPRSAVIELTARRVAGRRLS